MNPKDHPLFQKFPLNGKTTLTAGEVPTPYHIYDGYGLFIGGVCDPQAVNQLLISEGMTPILTTEGKVVAGLWICNFLDASLGPHTELQFSFFTNERESNPISNHPFASLVLMAANQNNRMFCYGLWNNTAKVVAYNRELLSLNARLSESKIDRKQSKIVFSFIDKETNSSIVSGEIGYSRRQSLQANYSLMSKLGFQKTLSMLKQPWLATKILNPLGVVLNRHATAEAYTKNETNVVRFFDSRRDTLFINQPEYQALGFVPACVQYMDGFKFVYLEPI